MLLKLIHLNYEWSEKMNSVLWDMLVPITKTHLLFFFLSREAFKEIGGEGKGGGADIAKNINNLCGSHWTIILLFVL